EFVHWAVLSTAPRQHRAVRKQQRRRVIKTGDRSGCGGRGKSGQPLNAHPFIVDVDQLVIYARASRDEDSSIGKQSSVRPEAVFANVGQVGHHRGVLTGRSTT